MNGIGDAFKVFDRRLYDDKPRPTILPIKEQLKDKPKLESDAVKIDLGQVARRAAAVEARDEESAQFEGKQIRAEESFEPKEKEQEKEGFGRLSIQV